jgi:hypothetical protein
MLYIRYENPKKFTLYGSPVKLAHLAATTSGYISSPVVPDFWIGWGGDLATAMVDTKNLSESEGISQEKAALIVVGALDNGSSFSYEDIITDIDSIILAEKIDKLNIVNSLINYYENITNLERRNRICIDLTSNSTPSLAKLYEEINNKMTGITGFKFIPPGIYTPLKDLAGNPTQELVNYTTMAFAKYIFSNLK